MVRELSRAWHASTMAEQKKDSEPKGAELGNEVDPKEQMRRALEAKKSAQHKSAGGQEAQQSSHSGPHGKVGGKREFRRKSG